MSDGSLTPVQVVVAGSEPAGMARHPTLNYLYLANSDDSGAGAESLQVYSVAKNGTLTELAGSPYTAGDMPMVAFIAGVAR